MSLLLRSRAAIGRIFRKQGLLINSFYVLRQGLQNFKLFAEGWNTETESGQEDKNKGSFELPEVFAGAPAGGAPAKNAKAPPPAKGKPAGKGGAPDAGTTDASEKAEEEAKRKMFEQKAEKERLRVEAFIKRRHPHMYLWLKTKVEIISILFMQRRLEDCADCIAVTKLEAMSIRDQFFIRKLDEIDFMIQVYCGQTQSALNKGRELRLHA
jgi:hypothetical protein